MDADDPNLEKLRIDIALPITTYPDILTPGTAILERRPLDILKEEPNLQNERIDMVLAKAPKSRREVELPNLAKLLILIELPQ